jgi:hypothetical protein
MLNTSDPLECIRRHICLMRWDLQEHRKSKLDQAEKDVIKAREAELLTRVNGVFGEEQVRAPDGYLAVIRASCETNDLDLEPDGTERLWRAASGAAHGKYWPRIDLQRTAVQETPDRSGTRSKILVRDTSAMVSLVNAAYRMTQYAVLRYANCCGANLVELHQRAMADIARALPLRDGIDPAWKEQFAADLSARLAEIVEANSRDAT